MGNDYETEEERQNRYRKEVLDKLNDNDKFNEVGKNVESFGMKRTTSKVNFNKNVERESNLEHQSNNVQKNDDKNSDNNKAFLFISLILIVVGIFLFPSISKKISEYKNSKIKPNVVIDKKEEEKVYEKITLQSEKVGKLVYPVFHSDSASKSTYYNKDKVTINDFSNDDILYNALINLYGSFFIKYNGNYNGKYCGAPEKKVSINARYIKLQISNMFTKKAKYTLKDFVVPSNTVNTSYTGSWKYDSINSNYIYYGDCNNKKSDTLYLDIKVPYDASSSDKNVEIYVYNYIGFAKVNVSDKSYVIYSDFNYNNEITKGVLKTSDYEKELTSILSNYNKDNLNKYKYTFSITNCLYQDYCFVSGEWVK